MGVKGCHSFAEVKFNAFCVEKHKWDILSLSSQSFCFGFFFYLNLSQQIGLVRVCR